MPHPIIMLLGMILDVYMFIVFAWVILSWLIAFNIVNRYQPFVQRLDYALKRMVDPVLSPIRRYMPDLGGVDISPIVLIILLYFLDYSLYYYFT